MIRLRLPELLQSRGWTAYHLAKVTRERPGLALGLSRAYRLAEPAGALTRLDLAVLDRLCEVLEVVPGDLLEYRPARKRGADNPTRR